MQRRNIKQQSNEQLKITLSTIAFLAMIVGDYYILRYAYQFLNGQIKMPELDISESNGPFIFDWFPLNLPNDGKNFIPLLLHVLHHEFPINYTALAQIGLGIIAGFAQLPFAKAAAKLEEKIYPEEYIQLQRPLTFPLSEDKAHARQSIPMNLPKEINKQIVDNPNFFFNAKYIAPVEEEVIFRGALTIWMQSMLYYYGFSLNNALMGSTLMVNTIFSFIHAKGLHLSSFLAGLVFSGLTVLQKGSLWGAVAAHMTNNIIASTNISAALKNSTMASIIPVEIKQNNVDQHAFFDHEHHSKKIKSKHKKKHPSHCTPVVSIEITDEEMANSVFAKSKRFRNGE